MNIGKRISKHAIWSSINGIIFAISILLFLQSEVPLQMIHKILVVVLYFSLGYMLSKYILLKQIKNFMIREKKVRSIICILSFCFTGIVCLGTGKEILLREVYQADNISIMAMGEKNTESIGTEVWIFDIEELKNSEIVEESKIEGDWEYRDDGIVSYQNQPNKINISLKEHDKPVILRFLKHSYSGIVEIKQGDIINSVDLYDKEGDILEYNVSRLTYKADRIGIIKIILLAYIMLIVLIPSFTLYFERLNYCGEKTYDEK